MSTARAEAVEQDSDDSEGRFRLDEMGVQDSPKGWFADVHVGKTLVSFKLDTGAEVTVVTEGICEPGMVKPSRKKLLGAGGYMFACSW